MIVVGNVGDPADRRVGATVERYRQHTNPTLVEHASWATDQLESRRIANSSATQPDNQPAIESDRS